MPSVGFGRRGGYSRGTRSPKTLRSSSMKAGDPVIARERVECQSSGFCCQTTETKNCQCRDVRVRKNTSLFALVVAAQVAACSGISSDTTAQFAAAPVGRPADYRQLIRTAVPAALISGAEVSELRKTVGPEPGDWVACLKTAKKAVAGAKNDINFIAVFFEGDKVIDFRQPVAIDRCESASYSPLPAAAPAKPKPLKPNKKRIPSR